LGREGSGRSGRVTLFLAVLNLLVFGAGIGLQYADANRMRRFSEFNAEKIRTWSQPEVYKPAAGTSVPPSVVSAEPPVVVATATPPVVESPPAAEPDSLCLSVENMSQANFEALQAQMISSGLPADKCSYHFDKKLGWWVFWPPEYEAARREKVLESIHTAGVKDVLPILQGPMAQAFSVGAFAFEDQARLYRNSLRKKGLDKIEYGPRPSIGSVRIDCQLDNPALLTRFKAALPVWAKPVETSQCGVPATVKPQSP
jgi:hypothetical protein